MEETKNEIEQFEQLYKDEYANLLRYASILFKRKDSSMPVNGRAEVAVQEMFVLAWTRRHEVLSSESPVGWLYKALFYKVKEILREEYIWNKKLMRYQQYYQTTQIYDISDITIESELLGSVSKSDFELLCRIYRDGYSYKEICDELKISKSALGVKVHRIKKKILDALNTNQ